MGQTHREIGTEQRTGQTDHKRQQEGWDTGSKGATLYLEI